IIGTVASIISFVFWPSLDAPDYLANISVNENKVIIAAFFELIMAVAVAGIPIMIYPILKKHNEGLALAHVGARLIEGVIYIVDAISLLTLLTLSQKFVKAGAPNDSYFQTSGTLLVAVSDWGFSVFATIVFAISALIFNHLLYQSKLIPRFIPVWGIIGAILVFSTGLLALYGNGLLILWIPIAVQEMVLAVWLIVKGFNSSAAIASGSA
ncbi:MAG: DUF4386 domain-containing protein, partial [bacterium]